MRYIATGQEVFRIDEFTTNVIGIPQLVLMERAASNRGACQGTVSGRRACADRSREWK